MVSVSDLHFGVPSPFPFGRQRLAPHVCIVDGKPHIRKFLAQTLEELGFVARECGRAPEVNTELKSRDLDLIVIGLLTPESDIGRVLHVLAMSGYRGKVMLFGARASMALLGLHDLGERIGLDMLPPLRTPFRDSDLLDNLSVFLPIAPPPRLPVGLDEALSRDWLELWYEPKIDLRQMQMRGVNAELRLQHPVLGAVTPETFVDGAGEAEMLALADFIVTRGFADWSRFFERQSLLELVLPLPLVALENSEFVDRLCRRLPGQTGIARLTIETAGIGSIRSKTALKAAARRLAASDIAISIADMMSELSWADIKDLQAAELCMAPDVIAGCADNRQKRTACSKLIDLARRLGARVTAKGLSVPDDFRAVCEMGFHFGQGELLGKPMDPGKFARTALRGRPVPMR